MPNIINSQVETDAKDFAGLKQAFFEYAQNNFAEIWSDFNEDQFMVLIADMLAYLGDLLTYYLDKQTAENFLTIAQLRQSIIDLGKMLDYTLQSQVPAGGEVTFTLDTTTFVYATPIPAGFRISNNGILTYETTVETLVTPGTATVIIPVLEGETIRETLVGDGPVGVSNATANQELTLDFINVILSNNLIDLPSDIEISVGGVVYSPVFNIVTAQSFDEVYTINTSDSGVTSIIFGNGVHGKIPPLGADIEATYRVLLADRLDNSFGNLNANALNTLEDSQTGMISVANVVQLSGGRDRESIEEARINIPRSLKAGDRAVSPDDFKSIAELFPGISKAIALKGTNDLDIDLYMTPDGGGFPSQQLKNDIITHFQPRKMAGTKVFPRDPIFQPAQLKMRVTAEANNRNVDIQNAITRALEALFAFDNMDFGQGIFLKSTGGDDIFDINETLEGVAGLANIKYQKIALKPFIYNKKFTNSGSPILLEDCCNIRQGAKRKEYEVVMDTPTQYLVKSKVFGKSTSLNDTRLEDNFQTFLLEDGASTVVGTSFLTDANKFFLVDRFQFQTLIDSAGTQFEILSNTKDTFTLASGAPVAGDYQIVERLVGHYVNPNINQSSIFLITGNDSNSVTVALGLSEVAVINDSYEVFRYETNKFDAVAHEGTETSGSATSTTFRDTTTVGFGDDFYNGMVVIFQDGPAANIPVEVQDFVSATGDFTVDTLGIGIAPLATNRYVVAPKFILGQIGAVAAIPTPTTTIFSAGIFGGEGDDFYNTHLIRFTSGVNDNLSRKVTDYNDASGDVVTVNAFPTAPGTGDTFQIAKEYQTDDQTITFAVISPGVSATDVYIFQVSELIGDLVPKENQILQLSLTDLELTVIGGS